MKRSFPYVEHSGDLPNFGTREDLLLDFKGRVNDDGTFERGKDLVSFANSSGGVLLIGAAEDRTRGILTRWLPYTDQDAQKIVREYTNVARDSCSPQPFIFAKPISLEDGTGFVIAINVRAHVTGQALFVKGQRHPPDEKPQVDVWACYRRVGDQNLEVVPTELPMLMLPQLRRAVILLRSIPDPKAVIVHVPLLGTTEGCIVNIDEEKNIFVVKPGGGASPRTFPLDAVDTAYATVNGSTWVIMMRIACT